VTKNYLKAHPNNFAPTDVNTFFSLTSVVDPHWFKANPDLESYTNADPDPDPGQSLKFEVAKS
jgi:hypothetical protein